MKKSILLFIFPALLLLISSCAVVSSNLMNTEDKLIFAGQYEKAIDEIERKYPISKLNNIISDSKSRIRKGQGADNYGLILYGYEIKHLITALIETGRHDRAWQLGHQAIQNLTEINRLSRASRKHYPSTTQLTQKLVSKLYKSQAYIAWFKTGDKDQWLALYDQGQKQFTTAEPIDEIYQHLEMGFFHEKILGNFEQALVHFDRVLSLTQKLGILNVDEKFNYSMQAYRRLMLINIKLGRLGRAQDLLQEYETTVSSAIYKAGRFVVKDSEIFRGYLSMQETIAGMIYAVQREFQQSETYFNRAWAVLDNIDPDSQLIFDQRALGTYYVMYGTYFHGLQNNIDQAIKYVDLGLKYLKPGYIESIQGEIDIETAYLYSAELYFLKGDYSMAHERAQKAISLSKRYFNHVTSAEALTLIGRIRIAQDDPAGALPFLKKAHEQIKNIQSTENWRLFYALGIAHEQTGNTKTALNQYKAAVREVEKLWSGRFDTALKQLSFMENRLIVFEPVIRLLIRSKEYAEAISYMERSKARTFYDTIQKITQQGKPTQPSLSPLNTEDIRKNLPNNMAILEYYIGEKIVAGAFISKKTVTAKYLDITAEDLQQGVYDFRNLIQGNGTDLARGISVSKKNPAGMQKEFREYEDRGRYLEKKLIQPFKHQFGNISRLCIIPHAVLHYLPFQALITSSADKTPKFLVEQYPILYAPSASVLFSARQRPRSSKKRLLAVGSPPYLTRVINGNTMGELEKLPFAAQEIKQVSALFIDKQIFLDTDATETAVKVNINQSDILLFSTHGKLMRQAPLESTLFFNKDIQNDGRLTVAEIEGLQNRADLVVLSACEAGLLVGRQGMDTQLAHAVFPPGDDLFGLQRAFLASGTRSVISTLWSVSDESTAELVTTFFRAYKKNGMDKAASLRTAQINLMKTKKEWRHPFFWAPFILSGDWQ